MSDAPALPTLRFTLPGEWAEVPLHEPEQARAAIRRLVDSATGRTDELATVRDGLRRRLFASVEGVIGGEAQSLHVALDLVEDVPLPVSFTVFLLDQRMTPAVGEDPAAVLDVLARGLASASVGMAPHRVGEVALRASSLSTTAEGLPSLRVDYWLPVPATKRVALVSFSTVLAGIAEEMTVLFDSIVLGTRWQESARTGEDEPVTLPA